MPDFIFTILDFIQLHFTTIVVWIWGHLKPIAVYHELLLFPTVALMILIAEIMCLIVALPPTLLVGITILSLHRTCKAVVRLYEYHRFISQNKRDFQVWRQSIRR